MPKSIVIAVVSVLMLAGCTATPASESTPLPTSTIAPGPVALSDEEAATRYLQIVCQGNAAGILVTESLRAGEAEFLQGGQPDPTAVKAAAAEWMRISRLQVEVLDDSYYTWPEVVGEQLVHIRSSFIADISPIESMVNASEFSDAYYAQFPELTSEQSSASQEIRYQLNLDADTVKSCVNYETALDELHTEMTERDAELAKFEE
jgi:hypothetical protein